MTIQRYIQPLLLAGLGAAQIGMAACAATGLRTADLLDQPLPESYFLPNPPAQVWQAMVALSARPEMRVLVSDRDARLLSWISEVAQDSPEHASLADPEMSSRSEKAMGITLMRAVDAPGGCNLFIRQTYFLADGSLTTASLSRGTYELALVRALRKSLQKGG